MFEAALGQIEGRRGRLGTGAILSVAAHVLVVGIALAVPRSAPETRADEPEVVFQHVTPPPPPPPPPGPKGSTQKQDKPRPVPKKTVPVLTEPTPEPPEPPPDDPPPSDPGDSDDATGGGGEVGGKEGGVIGGTGTGDPNPNLVPEPPPPPPPPQTLLFDAGTMERPVLLSGPQPAYTNEARTARVEGVVVAQCTITTEGVLRDCRIIKGLPHLEASVLDALERQRYKPVMHRGRPVNVRYVMTFRFKMQ
ncbi:energy transducer TonB [Polyangium aurulentum]|uniref:energy transducer TonB n=1 Tax=Polyangium aurulentum TaxID=2567896 RepID=UPI0010ADD046|nr:energy transducer TonB [Polyangium aurulentum]UQA59558.1 energy transducer TonB [Polyangium aurulentum]